MERSILGIKLADRNTEQYTALQSQIADVGLKWEWAGQSNNPLGSVQHKEATRTYLNKMVRRSRCKLKKNGRNEQYTGRRGQIEGDL